MISTPRPMRRTLKQRIEKASKRLAVQAKYAKLVEDRLADVEKRLEEMESQRPSRIEVQRDLSPASPASRTQRAEPKKRYTQILAINRVSFEHYRPKKSLDPKPEYLPDGGHRFGPTPVPDLPQRHVIDVVIPHISVSETSQSNPGIRVPVVSTPANVSHEDAAAQVPAVPDTQYVVPERIRINSVLLLDVLEYITGCKFTRLDIDRHEGELKTQVLIRPFKILVTYEHEIRQHVKDLEEKLASLRAKESAPKTTVDAHGEHSPELNAAESNASGPERASGSTSPRSEDLAARNAETGTIAAEDTKEASERRLQELQALVEVLDVDLKPVFDLRRRIQDVDIRSIAFSDLWHLFRIGKEIRVNEGHSQVYRILDISGGRPALCTRADATFGPLEPGAEANDHTIFTISCFRYGFNGRHLGPIQRIFDIQKYDDPKPITSLPVYPVEFSGIEDDGDLKREDLVLRGRKFVQLTKDESSVVHKRYQGLSVNLEQLREEVRV